MSCKNVLFPRQMSSGQQLVLEKLKEFKAYGEDAAVKATDLKYAAGIQVNMSSLYDSLRRLNKGKIIKKKDGKYWIAEDWLE